MAGRREEESSPGHIAFCQLLPFLDRVSWSISHRRAFHEDRAPLGYSLPCGVREQRKHDAGRFRPQCCRAAVRKIGHRARWS